MDNRSDDATTRLAAIHAYIDDIPLEEIAVNHSKSLGLEWSRLPYTRPRWQFWRTSKSNLLSAAEKTKARMGGLAQAYVADRKLGETPAGIDPADSLQASSEAGAAIAQPVAHLP